MLMGGFLGGWVGGFQARPLPRHSPRPIPLGMTIVVNGEARELARGASLRQLIEAMGLGKAACAAEVNKELVPKREHATRELREGDVVELVSLVGGG